MAGPISCKQRLARFYRGCELVRACGKANQCGFPVGVEMVRRREVLLGLGAIASGVAWPLWRAREAPLRVRERPLKFSLLPFGHVESTFDPAVLDVVRQRLRVSPQMAFSDLLHWLRIFAVQASPEYLAASSRDALALLTDARRIEERYGQAGVIVPTKNGVRFLSRLSGLDLKSNSRPSHPCQELAIFGEIGLPSSTTITTAVGDFSLKDAIRDCLRNLQVREAMCQEPEWATQVLVHYLPPVRSWRNRWGEELTFERWTEFLIDRDVARYSCGGTHLLHSLALILQANSQHPVLSRDLAERVRRVCVNFSRTIEATQHSDGAWRSDWRQANVIGEQYARSGVHLTGHILESQLYLPKDLRISDRAAGLALRYLAGAYRISDEQVVSDEYCYYSHAGFVLLQSSE